MKTEMAVRPNAKIIVVAKCVMNFPTIETTVGFSSEFILAALKQT